MVAEATTYDAVMRRFAWLGVLVAAVAGCSAAPQGIGLTGTPKSRDSEPVVKTDLKSVSLRKGALVAEHDLVADNHCGGRCNFRRQATAQLELTIEPQGVARVADRGEQLEEFRSGVGDTTETLTWSRTWSGSWTEGNGEVLLTLRPDTTTCERRPAASDDACHEVPLVLSCRAGSINLHTPKNKVARAWVCRPRGRVVAGSGITPFPWIFGVDYQVDTSDRARGNRISRFFLGDPPAEPKKRSSL